MSGAAPVLKAHPGVRFLKRLGDRPDLSRVLDGYAHDFPLCRFSDPERWRARSRLGLKRYQLPNQRPRFYFPHLAATPWYGRDRNAKILERAVDTIRAEFRTLESFLRSHPQQYLVQGGAWNAFTLVRDARKWEENCARCPETMRVIDTLPACYGAGGTIYFSVVEPGTRIKPHCGFTNARIRYHLGLEVTDGAWLIVAGERRCWKQDECLIFDDSFEHEVSHEGHARRVVLIVDCWHPDLTPDEIAFVREVQTLFHRPLRRPGLRLPVQAAGVAGDGERR